MTSWRTARLGSLCREMTVGFVGRMSDQYVEDGIPFLRSQDINPGRVDVENLKFISPEFHSKIRKSSLAPGDVVVVRTGYPGTAAVVPDNLKVANCADLVIVRPGQHLDARFVAFVFNSPWGRARVAGHLVGAAQQHFNVKVAHNLELPIPPIEEQRRIASILGAYDDLIKVNRRRLAVLEEMARGLFEEWFVRFRFPGSESVIAGGGEGVLPDGWRVGKVSDIASICGRNISPAATPDALFAHFSLPAFDAGMRPVIEAGSAIMSNKLRFEAPTVLVSKLNPRIARVWHVLEDQEEPQIASTEFVPLAPLPGISSALLYLYVSSPDFKDRLTGMAGGTSTSHQRVRPADILNNPIFVPTQQAVNGAGRKLTPILVLMDRLTRSNHALGAVRDLLLSRLISGELSVATAEQELEVAA